MVRSPKLALSVVALVACHATGSRPLYRIETSIVDLPARSVTDLADKVAVVPAAATRSLADRDGAQCFSRPRIVVSPDTRAEIANLQETGYVADVNLVDDREEPIMRTVEEGVSIVATPHVSDGGRTSLDVEVSSAALAQPFRTARTKIPGAEREVTLQLPELAKERASGTYSVDDESAVVMRFPLPRGADGVERVRLVVVRARRDR